MPGACATTIETANTTGAAIAADHAHNGCILIITLHPSPLNSPSLGWQLHCHPRLPARFLLLHFGPNEEIYALVQ